MFEFFHCELYNFISSLSSIHSPVYKTFAVNLIIGGVLILLVTSCYGNRSLTQTGILFLLVLKQVSAFQQHASYNCKVWFNIGFSSSIQAYRCIWFLYKPADIYTGILCRRQGSSHHYCMDLDSMGCLKIEDNSTCFSALSSHKRFFAFGSWNRKGFNECLKTRMTVSMVWLDSNLSFCFL